MSLAVHLALVVVQILFSGLAIVGRFVLPEFPATALIVLRVAGAAAVLLVVHLLRRGTWVTDRRDLMQLGLLGLLGITLNQSLFIFGLAHTTAINAVILVTTTPAFTVLGSVLLGREPASARKFAGIALAAAGAVYLIGPDRLVLDRSVAIGNLLIVLAMICYAAYFLFAKQLVSRYDPFTVTMYVMLLSLVSVLPIGLPALAGLDVRAVRGPIWAGVAFIVVGPTAGAYLLNIWALRRTSSNAVAVYIYLQPILTAAVAPLLLTGERVTPRAAVAGLTIFAGVSLVLLEERRQQLGSAPRPSG